MDQEPTKRFTVIRGLSLFAAGVFSVVCQADLPPGAALIDDDLIGDLLRPGVFALSDDGAQVAYASRGTLWLAATRGGPPKRLADLPDTRTDFLRETGYAKVRDRFNVIGAKERAEAFRPPHDRPRAGFYGLKWSREQDGVFYAIANNRSKGSDYAFEHRYFFASCEGEITEIACVVRGRFDEMQHFDGFEVTADRDTLVLYQYGRPLIWDIASGRARVTPYTCLVASSTSGRFLGVEIDTGQIVVTDPGLLIERRVDYRVAAGSYGLRFFWAPDERHAVLLIPLPEAPRRQAVAVRIDLRTGRSRRLAGGYINDRFVFTGNGGELVRWGVPRGNTAWNPDGRDASQVVRVPDGDGAAERIVRAARPNNVYGKHHQPWREFQPVVFDRSAARFVMAMPRPDNQVGFRCRLFERVKPQRELGADDPLLYVSPFHVLGFVCQGEALLACDGTRLFSVAIDRLRRTNSLDATEEAE